MPDIYSVTMVADGITYTVHFFGSFTGHFHPFTPTHPKAIDEIGRGLYKYNGVPYCQGWYFETENGPRLGKLLKFTQLKEPIKVDIKVSTTPGVYYHRVEKVSGVWKIREQTAPETILKQGHYFKYVVNKNSEIEFAFHIYAALVDSYIYTYSRSGAFDKVVSTAYDWPEKIPD